MDATNPSIKINHPSNEDAHRLFQHYLSLPTLVPLCREAQANVPNETENRSMVLVQQVVDRVYNAARAWKSFVPTEVSYTKDSLPAELHNGFFATQKANHVYQNLMTSSKGTPEGAEFVNAKFNSAEEMYAFFHNKKVVGIRKNDSQEIIHFFTLMSFLKTLNSHLSLQNCDLAELTFQVNNNPDLKHLDVSYNNIQSIQENFSFDAKLTSLNLSYNRFESAPSNLPRSLQELRLRGNPIQTLEAFSGLEKLRLLDISYMDPNFRIDLDFWEKVQTLKIVISPNMRIFVPEAARDKAFVVSSLNEMVRLFYDEKGFVGSAQPVNESHQSRSSSTTTHSSSSRLRRRSIWPMVGLISAVIGVLAFVITRFWPRARSS